MDRRQEDNEENESSITAQRILSLLIIIVVFANLFLLRPRKKTPINYYIYEVEIIFYILIGYN